MKCTVTAILTNLYNTIQRNIKAEINFSQNHKLIAFHW